MIPCKSKSRYVFPTDFHTFFKPWIYLASSKIVLNSKNPIPNRVWFPIIQSRLISTRESSPYSISQNMGSNAEGLTIGSFSSCFLKMIEVYSFFRFHLQEGYTTSSQDGSCSRLVPHQLVDPIPRARLVAGTAGHGQKPMWHITCEVYRFHQLLGRKLICKPLEVTLWMWWACPKRIRNTRTTCPEVGKLFPLLLQPLNLEVARCQRAVMGAKILQKSPSEASNCCFFQCLKQNIHTVKNVLRQIWWASAWVRIGLVVIKSTLRVCQKLRKWTIQEKHYLLKITKIESRLALSWWCVTDAQ